MTRSRLGSFSVALVLCLVVLGPALTFASAPGAAATNSDTADTYVVEQGGECIQLEPHGDGSETVEAFYDYRNPSTDPPGNQWSSYGTTDIQENQVSKLFVHNGSEGTSLVFLHDKAGDGQLHGSTATFDITQLPEGSWAVQDDVYFYDNDSQDDEWETSESTAAIDWKWRENRSDGGAYRGLHNMDSDDAIVVEPGFNENADRWGSWGWSGDSENRTTEWVARSADGTETTLDMSQQITIERGICGPDETSPTANADASPTTVAPNETVTFDASNSMDNVGIERYEWDVDGDGSADATGETVTHAYETNGSYEATLTVTDGAGNENTSEVTITVEAETTDEPPTAALRAPGSASPGESVTFDASNSSDDDGIDEYRWDVGDDGSVDATTDDPMIERNFSETGNRTVAVTVADGSNQTATDSATVTVSDETSPTASANASATTVEVGTSIEFDATDSTDDDAIASYEWAFGDGQSASGETTAHAYEANGTYEVALTVTDEAGNRDTDNVTITVEAAAEPDAPPTAALTAQGSATVNETVTFDASGSTDDDELVEYRWDVDGDGTADERTADPTLERSFSESGDHAVTVTVVDGSDQTDAATATVTVESDEESGGDDGSDGSDEAGDSSDSDDSDDSSDSDDSDDSDTPDESDDTNDESPDNGGSAGSTGGTAPAEDESSSASVTRAEDGRLVVTVENAVQGEAVSADVPGSEGGATLRSVELVPATDADRLNVTFVPRSDVPAPSGTDAGLYELRTEDAGAVETVTYEFAVDRADVGESGELRVLAAGGSGVTTVDHAVVENESTMVVEATTSEVDRVVLAAVAPDVSARSIATGSTATAGEPVTVETTLVNDGHADANRTVDLAVDGTVVDSETVTVPATGVANVSFETTFDAAGDRRLSVDGTEKTISVAAGGQSDADRATDTTDGDQSTATDGAKSTATDDAESPSTETEVSDEEFSTDLNQKLAVAGFGVLVIGAAALTRVL